MWTIKPEDFVAIDEIEYGSDRVAGVVTGAIIDSRISEILRRDLRRDESDYSAKIRNEMFNPDGPLGTFGAKSGLAYLMGYFTTDAHADLQAFGKIRNSFAHITKQNSFESESIKSRCCNFKLINDRVFESDSHITMSSGKVEYIEAVGYNLTKRIISLHLIGAKETLATPRGRYITTAKIFCAAFDMYFRERVGKPII